MCDDSRQVVADVLHQRLEQKSGRARRPARTDKQQDGEDQVEFAQAPDAGIQAGDHRGGGHER